MLIASMLDLNETFQSGREVHAVVDFDFRHTEVKERTKKCERRAY